MNNHQHHKILLVEDEKNLGVTLSEKLKDDGYDLEWVRSLSEARSLLQNTQQAVNPFRLIILDVGLPDGSGFDLAEELQSQNRPSASKVSILFLTAWGLSLIHI